MQYTINTGSLPNDGTGTPLRTAFNDTNLNFNQIFAAGPVGSNIQISNNTILTTNTNGNLILATNGIGVITTAAAIQPDQPNLRMIGAYNNRFNTLYTQYLDTQSAIISGNLAVNGNLYVQGNTVTVNVATLNVANTVITAAAGAPYPALADGAGLAVGGAGATFLYSATANAWSANLPIEAPAFIGDGSQLTNVNANVSALAMSGNTINANVLYSSLVQVGTLTNLSVAGNLSVGQNILSNTITTGEITAIGFYGNGAGLTAITGSQVVGNVANATYSTFAGTAGSANVAATATQAVNAQNALHALNAQTANTAQFADIANWANCADNALTAYQANSAVVAGRAETIDIQSTITVTGNIVAGGILTNNYYFANGTPATFGGGTNYSNANVAAYLPTYSGDLLNLGNITSYGTANLGNTNINSTLTVGVVSAQGNISGAGVYANGFFFANGTPFTGSGYVLGDQQFYGNGSAGPYTMTQSSTNNALLVTINGLTQTPGTTYNVSGNLITFSDGINTNELVDLRFLGTGAGGGSANTGNIRFDGDTIYDINGMSLTNGDLSFGPTAAITLPSNGLPDPLEIVNTYGNISVIAGYDPGNTVAWNFDGSGNLTLPSDTSSINYANGQPYGGSGGSNYGNANVAAYLPTYEGNIGVLTFSSYHDIVGPSDGNGSDYLKLVAPDDTRLATDYGNIEIWTEGGKVWKYDNLGNLTLPFNTSSINYPNGQPYGGVIQSNTAPGNATASTIWYDTVSGRTYVYYNDGTTTQWVDASPAGTDFGNVSANVIPLTNNTYTLGNVTNGWANVYSNNILANNFFYANGQPFVSGGVVQSNTAPGNATSSTLWYDTVSGRTYVYYNDGTTTQWVDSSPAGTDFGNVAANVVPLSNDAYNIGNATNQWANVYAGNILSDGYYFANGQPFVSAANLLSVTTNIVPSGNNVQSLGNATNQWESLWVSNSTIYFNSVPMSVGPGNTLSIGSANVVTTSGAGNILSAANISVTGNIAAAGNLSGGNLNIGTINGTGTITINPDPNTSGLAWQFGDEGSNISLLTAPQSDNANIGGILLPGYSGEGYIGWLGNTGNAYGTQFANTLLIDSSNTVTIGTNFGMGFGNTGWVFDNAGNLTLPAGAVISDTSNDGVELTVANPPTTIVVSGADFVAVNLTYTRDANQATPTWYPAGYNPSTDPYILFDNSGWGIFVPGFVQALYVNTGTITAPLTQWNTNPPLGSVAPTGVYTFYNPIWQFGTDGSTTFPGNIVGNGASPAPSINGFDTINAITFSATGNVTGNVFTAGSLISTTGNVVAIGGVNTPNVSITKSFVFTGLSGNASINNSANISTTGNVIATGFYGSGSALSGVAQKTTGSWTLAPGVNTVSFTVPPGGNYSMWVNGNIPNGIVMWNATVSTSNTNVPVIGTQYGWYYTAGGQLVLTSIPSQIIGTAGGISTATVVTTTANVFTFGITNNSGTSQVVNWGYITL